MQRSPVLLSRRAPATATTLRTRPKLQPSHRKQGSQGLRGDVLGQRWPSHPEHGFGGLRATSLLPLLHGLRAFSTSPSTSSPPPPKHPSFIPPLSFAARSNLVRLSTRRQLRQLQHELIRLRRQLPTPSRSSSVLLSLVAALAALLVTYKFSDDFRRIVLAAERCARVGWAVTMCIIDYKLLFRKEWEDSEEGKAKRHQDYEDCHLGCAVRLREVLKRNGGIYIKLGQHLSSVQLIPVAWSSSMKPLQDQCFPTPLAEIQALFLSELGAPLSAFFSDFDPNPIGVASLAQVHVATDRESGRKVAVKIMHPDLEEFCAVDMKTTTVMLKVVKSVFPDFEFTWLGEEMEQNLPLEMDFRHEAANAARCAADFADLKETTLVIPAVLWAKRRAMVMEFIDGARVDNLRYLAEHNIDRNRVAQELSRIFSRMIYITGFFHADPHQGNLLIRPVQPNSRSPYNFEIVLLDHGLYFSMNDTLRVNYARLWLALISPSSPTVEADRRKYAYLAGNIDDSLYPIFQAAITGRAALDPKQASRGSMMELGEQTTEEARQIRNAVVNDGLILSIFDLLRRVPRTMLMVLKVNDLTRSLDASLHTTHGPARIFLIVGHFCNIAAFEDDRAQQKKAYRTEGLSLSLLGAMISSWWRFQTMSFSLRWVERAADVKAGMQKWRLWWRGMRREGWRRAWEEAAGIMPPATVE